MNGNKEPEVAEEVADRLKGRRVIRRVDVACLASEAAEKFNRELKLEIENPDNFSELRDSIEEAVLEHLHSKNGLSIV